MFSKEVESQNLELQEHRNLLMRITKSLEDACSSWAGDIKVGSQAPEGRAVKTWEGIQPPRVFKVSKKLCYLY